MESTATVHLGNALSAAHNSQLTPSPEKPSFPVDLNTALSLLARPTATVSLPAPFPHFSPFSFTDPSTLFAFSQHLRSSLPSYQASAIVSPLSSSTATSTISTAALGPTPLKRPNREQQSASTPPSCSSSVTSSCSPTQQSPHRKQAAPVPDEKKDEAYYERRRKNNDAAKRSRDARRQKEEAVAARAAFLEQENIQLRSQVVLLKNETAKLQLMLFSKPELLDPKLLPSGRILDSSTHGKQLQQEPELTDGEHNGS